MRSDLKGYYGPLFFVSPRVVVLLPVRSFLACVQSLLGFPTDGYLCLKDRVAGGPTPSLLINSPVDGPFCTQRILRVTFVGGGQGEVKDNPGLTISQTVTLRLIRHLRGLNCYHL